MQTIMLLMCHPEETKDLRFTLKRLRKFYVYCVVFLQFLYYTTNQILRCAQDDKLPKFTMAQKLMAEVVANCGRITNRKSVPLGLYSTQQKHNSSTTAGYLKVLSFKQEASAATLPFDYAQDKLTQGDTSRTAMAQIMHAATSITLQKLTFILK